MEAEIHIAGVLVHARSGQEPSVADAVSALPGAEVRAVDAPGKLVVVCEGTGSAAILALIERIRELPGVVNVALVYQHSECASALQEVIGNDPDPPRVH